MKQSDQNRAILAEVVARAWRQPEFRTELVTAPKQTLKAAGMDIQDDVDVVILENTASIVYAVLPTLADQAEYQAQLDAGTKGIGTLPENMELRIIRDTPKKVHVILPVAPVAVSTGKLGDEALEQIAGGSAPQNVEAYTVVQDISVVVQQGVVVSMLFSQGHSTAQGEVITIGQMQTMCM